MKVIFIETDDGKSDPVYRVNMLSLLKAYLGTGELFTLASFILF